MNIPVLFAKNFRRRGFLVKIVVGIALAGIILPHLLEAQEEETKASVGVTVGGVTPMGEVRVEVPAGTSLEIVERADGTVKVRKGPFCGSVTVRQTTLWQPTPAPRPSSSPSTLPAPQVADYGIMTVMNQWWLKAVDFLTACRPVPVALEAAIASLIIFLSLVVHAISRRVAEKNQGQILKNELELVRRDLRELHTLLDASRNHTAELTIQRPKEPFAPCPHCERAVFLSTLHKGANTCASCGGEFLYE